MPFLPKEQHCRVFGERKKDEAAKIDKLHPHAAESFPFESVFIIILKCH